MIILMIFKVLKSLGIVDELMVLAKRRIILNVWPKEISKWRDTRKFKYSIVHGGKKEDALYKDADIRLMNYEGLPWLKRQKKWFKRGKRVMLAVDESSKLRHTNTVRFRTLKSILKFFDRRYIMTGSPAPNGLMGLFGQIYTLDLGEAFGPYITAFRNEYFYPSGYMGYAWELQRGAKKRMFRRIRHLILRFGDEKLDLPPLTYVDRYVQLDDKSMATYRKMEKEFVLEYNEGDIVAANAAVASGKLRQIANGGAFYSETGEIVNENPLKPRKKWRKIHDAKCEELVDLLEELNGEPALIAYEFRHDMERMKRYFAKHAPQFKDIPFIGGHTKDKEVEKYLRQWDKGTLPGMAGQPDSIAHGLNLQEGRGGIVIFFSLTWNLENYEQFIRRIWRQGQKRRVIVYRIIAQGTVDEIMVDSLHSKDKTQRSLLKAMEKRYGKGKERLTLKEKVQDIRGKYHSRIRTVH